MIPQAAPVEPASAPVDVAPVEPVAQAPAPMLSDPIEPPTPGDDGLLAAHVSAELLRYDQEHDALIATVNAAAANNPQNDYSEYIAILQNHSLSIKRERAAVDSALIRTTTVQRIAAALKGK